MSTTGVFTLVIFSLKSAIHFKKFSNILLVQGSQLQTKEEKVVLILDHLSFWADTDD